MQYTAGLIALVVCVSLTAQLAAQRTILPLEDPSMINCRGIDFPKSSSTPTITQWASGAAQRGRLCALVGISKRNDLIACTLRAGLKRLQHLINAEAATFLTWRKFYKCR